MIPIPAPSPPPPPKKEERRGAKRRAHKFPILASFATFLVKRLVTLGVMVFAGIYITVVIANYGGYFDDALRAEIEIRMLRSLPGNSVYQNMTAEEQDAYRQAYLERAYEARGLNEPVWTKSLRYTWELMTFNFGQSNRLLSAESSRAVSSIILERVPRTLLLFTTGALLSAYVGIRLGLRMARKVLTTEDRSLSALSIVTGSVPSWVWGILLIVLLAYRFPVFPGGGIVSVPAKRDLLGAALDVGYHMVLPVLAIVLASFGGWAYTTRNLVLQIQDDDYVQAAKARGLPDKVLMNRYVLRAASPPIVTSLALALIATWAGSIILEMVFNWPGMGRLLWDAMDLFADRPNVDVAVVAGILAVYAYLLAFTMFLLDLIYGLLDPRVRVSS